jgi:hypothetical protein
MVAEHAGLQGQAWIVLVCKPVLPRPARSAKFACGCTAVADSIVSASAQNSLQYILPDALFQAPKRLTR